MATPLKYFRAMKREKPYSFFIYKEWLICYQRYTNGDLKSSLYACVHIKPIP